MNNNNPELSIILPCLNEEAALPSCLDTIKEVIQNYNIAAEIIVVNNGSTDHSVQIAKNAGAIVINEEERGYGASYLKGVETARGIYLFLADCDGTYDFNEIPRFLNALKQGSDFIIGNRFKGTIQKGAMPWARRYLGNPILSFIAKSIFRLKISDIHCGMRAIRKKAFEDLKLKTTGMEFASEMVIMAKKRNLSTIEFPINYYKRTGESKLRSVHDGWRHLRFIFLYSPLYLFFIPGFFLAAAGAAGFSLLYFDSLTFFNIKFYYHPMFFASQLIITGYQLIIFSLFAKTYAITHLRDKPIFDKLYRYVTIKNAGITGLLVLALGVGVYVKILSGWISSGFGALNEVKNSILALTLVTIGIQTIFSSFILSILGIKEK